MTSPRFLLRVVCCLVFATGWSLAAHRASAQQQDQKLFDRIMTPNMDLHAEGFGKAFEPGGAAGENKGFFTRLFGGSRSATDKTNIHAFRTAGFGSGKDRYTTASFSTKKSAVASQSAAQYSRAFDTKAVAVNEDRAAGKSATTQNYEPSGKLFTEKGKRQDDIDDLRRQKNLTSDQVREILNKNK